MENESVPFVVVSHSLPDGWLDKLHNRTKLIIGPPEGNQLTEILISNLGLAQGLFTLLTVQVDEQPVRCPSCRRGGGLFMDPFHEADQ